MPTLLLHFPLELLIHTMSLLDDGKNDSKKDIKNVRLTCSALHDASWDAFGQRYFGTFQLDFSTKKTDRLCRVAHHEKLRFSVQRLLLTHGSRVENEASRLIWARDSSGRLDLTSTRFTDLFSLIKERLVNCKKVDRLSHYDTKAAISERCFTCTDQWAVVLGMVALNGVPFTHVDLEEGVRSCKLVTHHLHLSLYRSPTFLHTWGKYLTTLVLGWGFFREGVRVGLDLIMNARNLKELDIGNRNMENLTSRQQLYEVLGTQNAPKGLFRLGMCFPPEYFAANLDVAVRLMSHPDLRYIRVKGWLERDQWDLIFETTSKLLHLGCIDISHAYATDKGGVKGKMGQICFCHIDQEQGPCSGCHGLLRLRGAELRARLPSIAHNICYRLRTIECAGGKAQEANA
ncbi:hypothetical protein EJ05DRAFT_508381 [Pseudovirgaria hyperparasitica]|uniref:F-box domain-containing protein n=1 Tax=Pseudovirgaria hyperparasitica TaxID=470096 RepID=A0A6A6WIX0_9PEZI|nr:uncharacterized protein EJ05DRAFT_508381 [Pseudovirgaria hyperparasitica]KAF2761191.1 hypothetical protein EJ05DRAFT_508381 [Pseudovirgaria hyperparasitica]